MAGTSGKVRLEGDDDAEGASTEQQGAAIREALGTETRNKVRWQRKHRSAMQAAHTSEQIALTSSRLLCGRPLSSAAISLAVFTLPSH